MSGFTNVRNNSLEITLYSTGGDDRIINITSLGKVTHGTTNTYSRRNCYPFSNEDD